MIVDGIDKQGSGRLMEERLTWRWFYIQLYYNRVVLLFVRDREREREEVWVWCLVFGVDL